MGTTQDSKKGKPSKAGRRKGQFVNMFAKCEERKLNHVAKHNGTAAARELKDYFWELKFGRTTKHRVKFSKEKIHSCPRISRRAMLPQNVARRLAESLNS